MKNIFKLLTIVCFVASVTMFSSCKKSNEDLIVGSWKCSSITSEPQEDPSLNLFIGATFTFNADKTRVANVLDEVGKGTYAVDGNKLTMTLEGESMVADIITLDKKKLSFSYTETDEDEPVKVTMNFDKQ